jgi:hypothetical protein
MSQVLTSEEMEALFEGLRETEDEPGFHCCGSPGEIMARGRIFPEGDRMSGCHNLSDWLLALADLHFSHS